MEMKCFEDYLCDTSLHLTKDTPLIKHRRVILKKAIPAFLKKKKSDEIDDRNPITSDVPTDKQQNTQTKQVNFTPEASFIHFM